MKRKIFAFLFAFAFVAGTIGYTSAENNSVKSDELAVLLPESDMVMTLDSERFVSQALPQILSSNQPMLAKINAEINNIKEKTGMDVRQFKQVAVGIKSNKVSATQTDYDPVILARGTIPAKTLVAVARMASNGNYKTVKDAGRTIYIFSPKEAIDEKKGKFGKGNTVLDTVIGSLSGSIPTTVAITAYDSNTIAIGTPTRIKETIGNTPRISNDVLGMLNRNPGAIINFGAKVPTGLSRLLPLDDDELGDALDSIRQMQGSMDVVENNTVFSLIAKANATEQAETLESSLLGLQLVGSKILGGMKGEDKKVYGRTIGNLEISREADELMVNLKVPQSDIDAIIGKK